MTTIEKVIGGLTLLVIVIGLLVQQFWFVPYYIDAKVDAKVKALAAEAGIPSWGQTIQTDVAAIKGQLLVIGPDVATTKADAAETKNLFIDFLRDQ